MDRGEEFNQLRLRFTDPIQHDLDEAEWQRAWLRPPYIHRQIQGPVAAQLPLWAWAGLLCFYLFSS